MPITIRIIPALVVFALVMASSTAPVGAWTGTTDRAILARALGTMPRSLRLVLTGHRGELYRATRASGHPGLLAPERFAAECDKAIRMIREQQPFALTARQLGRVGLMAAATADPYLADAGNRGPAPAHQGFQQFTERMLHLIPFIILEDEVSVRTDLLAGELDPADFLRQGIALSAGYSKDLEAHVPGSARGSAPWADFDARSTPFGVSSISVSRAACRVSAIWLWIWQEAGGATGLEQETS